MKPTERPAGSNRRDFMRASVRWALGAGLAAVAALLVKRNGGKLSGQTCVNQGVCARCGVFSGCGLPAALSAKAYQLQSRRPEAGRTSTREARP